MLLQSRFTGLSGSIIAAVMAEALDISQVILNGVLIAILILIDM